MKDELAGKKIRCPSCKQVLAVPKPGPAVAEEDEALGALLAEDVPLKKRNQPSAASSEDDARVTAKPPPWSKSKKHEDDEGTTVKPAPWTKAKAEDAARERPKRKRRSRDDDDRGSFLPAISISPTIISGLLMMIGAVVWFVLGLVLLDMIYFYPPILFVLGIGAVWRGVNGQED